MYYFLKREGKGIHFQINWSEDRGNHPRDYTLKYWQGDQHCKRTFIEHFNTRRAATHRIKVLIALATMRMLPGVDTATGDLEYSESDFRWHIN